MTDSYKQWYRSVRTVQGLTKLQVNMVYAVLLYSICSIFGEQ